MLPMSVSPKTGCSFEAVMGKWKDVARGTFCRVLDVTGANMLYRSRNARKLTILYYHGVWKEGLARRTGKETPHCPAQCFAAIWNILIGLAIGSSR